VGVLYSLPLLHPILPPKGTESFGFLTPINGISALTKLFSARKTQKIISNLLKKSEKMPIIVKVFGAGGFLRLCVPGPGVYRASSVNPQVPISLGVATVFPSGEMGPEALIESADKALYDAKASGRNRVVFRHVGE